MKQSMGVAVLAVSLMLLGLPMTAGSAESSATQIIKYVPVSPGEGTREGSCWTNSIAAPRPDAWRCMAGNEIFDPCFELPGAGSVVCDPEPAQGKPGLGLKLTKPLPRPELAAGGGENADRGVWLIELADATLCSRATGAMGLVDGKPTTFYCESKGDPETNVVLLGDPDTGGPLWIVEKATLSAGPKGSSLQNIKKVPVQRAWR